MKKILATISALVLGTICMMAIVAPKTPFKYTQPDGSVVTLVNHGDEFHHWTTMNGQVVTLDADGFWRPAANPSGLRRASTRSIARRQEAARMASQARQSAIGMGEKPFLVLLIEFSDLSFTVDNAQEAFYNMLNEANYSANGGTGSVRDYYMENSRKPYNEDVNTPAQFTPTFDVVGPVKVGKEYKYYGGNDSDDNDEHPDELLYDACVVLLSQGFDFRKYDNDGDGYVDNIFFYYAGHNEAEGGGDDTIWPHAWSLYPSRFPGKSLDFGGVTVGRYACSSEYNGSKGTTMAGIGTFCHEFGHVIGLPDFYDTDYESHGSADDMDYFSLMSTGPYLNSGRTPPFLTAIERNMLGWKSGYSSLSDGKTEILPISGGHAYRTDADVDGEFFVYEVRGFDRWDAYLPEGLLIYHVDRSSKYLSRWSSNTLNAYSEHPCCYVVASSGYNSLRAMVYPGSGNVTSYIPKAWSGKEMPVKLSGITLNSGSVSFNAETNIQYTIAGKVSDADGNPLSGAQVLAAPVSAQVRKASAGKLHSNSVLPKDASYSVTTGSDGSYEIVLSDDDTSGKFSVTASCSGFMDKTIEVEIAGYENIQNFILRPVGSVEDYQLYKFDTGASLSALGYGSAYDMMGGVKFYATELSPYVGMNLSELAFAVNCGSAANLYVVVDYDGKRVLSRKVEDPKFSGTMNVVDISDANLVIPANTAVVIGYAVQSPGGKSSGYPLLTYKNSASGGAMYQNFSLSDSLWDEYEGACIAMSARVVGDLDPGTGEITLAIMGFNSIDNPKEGAYSAGDTFTFNLLESYHNKPSSVVWYFDGAEQSAGTVTLTAGKHTVAAKLVYSDGSAEDITLELNVN